MLVVSGGITLSHMMRYHVIGHHIVLVFIGLWLLLFLGISLCEVYLVHRKHLLLGSLDVELALRSVRLGPTWTRSCFYISVVS